MTNECDQSSGSKGLISNRPFIVGALFLATYFVPFLILLGVTLAYIFKREQREDWEFSHFYYLIRTFWIAIISAIGVLAVAGLAAFVFDQFLPAVTEETLFIFLALAGAVVQIPIWLLCGVRTILSLINAAAHDPMPKPKSWLL